MSYYKLFNGDAKPLNIKIELEGEDSNILVTQKALFVRSVAGKGHDKFKEVEENYIVVSEAVGKFVNKNYPSIEISEASLEDYQAYRRGKEQSSMVLASALKAKAKVDAHEKEAEAKRVSVKLAAQEIIKTENVAAEVAHLKKVALDEKALIEVLGGSLPEAEKKVITHAAPGAVEPKKRGRKPNKV